jgi:serine/threonine protein kinase/Tfp pilus assembly protein PilF
MSLTHREMARLGELLDEALVLTPEQRCAWLDSLSSGDQPLVRTLRDALLADETGAGGPLDRPPRIGTGGGGEKGAASRHAGERLGAYELLRPLGSGGMAEVWLAGRIDGAFEREVALKIPRLHNRPVEMTARFALECNILAALVHPGIARMYDAGVDASRVPYIAMEYVQGEPLVAWCDARGLDEPARIQIFLQLLDVVAYAHGRQVIHRDLKPSNILVTGQGEVRLLDFGTARLLQPETDAPSLTRVYGLALTPEYASPELLRGESIDSRSDIYSLGVVLHELLTGARPSQPARPAPGDTRRLRGALRDVVAKALQPDSSDRYPDAASFAAALRPFADGRAHELWGRMKTLHLWALALAALAVLLIGTVGAARYWSRPDATIKQPQIRSLAVLPLQSLDPTDHALGFGIADAVIRRISQTSDLTVRPASSVRHYLAEGAHAITAAKELSVDTVLEGTVQRAGGRLRISVNLLRADGTSLWTESFDTQMTDVFAAQDTISQQVASRLQLHLTAAQQARLSKRSTSNPVAYDYYTRGVYNYDQRGLGPAAKDQNQATIGLFKKALAADPNYALARARLAHAYAFHGVLIVPDEQETWIALANDEMNRADAIDAQLPETHLARALVLFSDSSGYRAAAAIREVRAAQQFAPSIGHHDLAGLYNHIGLEDLAEREFQKAFEIDPTSRILGADFVSYFSLLHRPDEYITAGRKHFPEDPVPVWYHIMKGDVEAARRRMDELGASNPGEAGDLPMAHLLGLEGERERSEELLAKAISAFPVPARRATNYHHFTYEIACVYAINGNGPGAMKWLRESAEKGLRSYTLFARDPFLDKIRRLPEFRQFIGDMRVEHEQLRNEFYH